LEDSAAKKDQQSAGSTTCTDVDAEESSSQIFSARNLAPSKRPRVDKIDDATKAMRSAQEVMANVCKRLCETEPRDQPHNETRAATSTLFE